MTQCQAYNELEKLTTGHTKLINGHVVTRWNEEIFEIGTWGREDKKKNFDQAADLIIE